MAAAIMNAAHTQGVYTRRGPAANTANCIPNATTHKANQHERRVAGNGKNLNIGPLQ